MNRKPPKIKAIGILLVLIIMLITGLLYVNNLNSINAMSSKNIKSLDLLGQVEAKDKNSSVCSLEDLLAEASGTVVKVQDIKGEAAWTKTLAGKIVNMKSEASQLYVLDSGKRLYCFSKSGKVLWDKQLEGEVKGLYADRNGDILIDFAYKGGTKIQILSNKGVDEGSIVLENAQVIDFASGKDENTVSIVDISSQIIKTKLLTLNLRGDLIWSENIDNQIIPLIGYSKDNSLIAVGEKALYKYKHQSKKQSKLDINKTIYNASISDSGVAVVLRSKKGYEAMVYDNNLKELGQQELEQVPTGIILSKNNYILYYSEKLLLVDLKGSVQAEYKSIPEINKAYYGADGSIISVSDRLVQKLGHKSK